MPSGYRVKTVVLTSGERLPVLLDRDGQPMFAPTVFTLTEVRGKNLAANTIGIVLRSVMAFHLFLDARGIDFDGRLASGELLSLGEVEDLARLCRRPLSELAALPRPSEGAALNVLSLEKVRMGVPKPSTAEVAPGVAAKGLLPDPLNAPLFPSRRRLGGEPAGFEYHRTTQTIADLLERTLGGLSAMSERTGRPYVQIRLL